jgi:hypothetical protein
MNETNELEKIGERIDKNLENLVYLISVLVEEIKKKNDEKT